MTEPAAYSRKKQWMIVGVVVGIPVVAFTSLLGARGHFNQEGCRSNLRLIGAAIAQYARDNQGNYPDSVRTLVRSQKLQPDLFVCPATQRDFAKTAYNEAAGGPREVNWRETAIGVAGEHLGYDYLGRGMTMATATAQTPVVTEPLDDHDGKGMNVLFGDGTVRWIDATTAERMGLR